MMGHKDKIDFAALSNPAFDANGELYGMSPDDPLMTPRPPKRSYLEIIEDEAAEERLERQERELSQR